MSPAQRFELEQLAALPGAGAWSGLWPTVLELLAAGQPVSIEQLASALDREPAEVQRLVHDMADTEIDDQGRIVGAGLTLRPTPHGFSVNGHRLYTWCAFDTLVFPILLGQPAWVESPCHASGRPVHVTVRPDAVTYVNPPGAVVSLVPAGMERPLRRGFCDHVHFFCAATLASSWLAEHPDGSVLRVADAFRLARQLAATMPRPGASTLSDTPER